VDNHANLFAAVHAKLGRNCRRRHRCEYIAPVRGSLNDKTSALTEITDKNLIIGGFKTPKSFKMMLT
jgi:hypothetical protein